MLSTLVLLCVAPHLVFSIISPVIVPVESDGFAVYKQYNQSSVYTITTASSYTRPVYLIDLHGSRYEQGFAYGNMLASEIQKMYVTFFNSLIGTSPVDDVLKVVLSAALDWQWNKFLSVQVPQDFKDEIEGIGAGGLAAGNKESAKVITRVIVLANAPGDLQDFVLVLLREFKPNHPKVVEYLATHMGTRKVRGMCSMFGVWGNRAEGNKLYTGRNLDWEENTGINEFKAITVFHPQGKNAHCVLGYIGVWGALTGMSAKGLTVHEANLEEHQIGFEGFPWLLRLRYIMENADNNTAAVKLWDATNNTVGFNHMVGSASDAVDYNNKVEGARPAVVFETMFNYTAKFDSMDSREKNATYVTNTTAPVQIGFPLSEAVFRTNHGYDPVIRKNFMWSQAPSSWSNERYVMMHNAIEYYSQMSSRVGLAEAVNITATVADKGHELPYICQPNANGTNVLSVAYSPSELVLAAAWERDNGTNWRPACCSPYLQINMTKWFRST